MSPSLEASRPWLPPLMVLRDYVQSHPVFGEAVHVCSSPAERGPYLPTIRLLMVTSPDPLLRDLAKAVDDAWKQTPTNDVIRALLPAPLACELENSLQRASDTGLRPDGLPEIIDHLALEMPKATRTTTESGRTQWTARPRQNTTWAAYLERNEKLIGRDARSSVDMIVDGAWLLLDNHLTMGIHRSRFRETRRGKKQRSPDGPSDAELEFAQAIVDRHTEEWVQSVVRALHLFLAKAWWWEVVPDHEGSSITRLNYWSSGRSICLGETGTGPTQRAYIPANDHAWQQVYEAEEKLQGNLRLVLGHLPAPEDVVRTLHAAGYRCAESAALRVYAQYLAEIAHELQRDGSGPPPWFHAFVVLFTSNLGGRVHLALGDWHRRVAAAERRVPPDTVALDEPHMVKAIHRLFDLHAWYEQTARRASGRD